jgi:hypothetical protein
MVNFMSLLNKMRINFPLKKGGLGGCFSKLKMTIPLVPHATGGFSTFAKRETIFYKTAKLQQPLERGD